MNRDRQTRPSVLNETKRARLPLPCHPPKSSLLHLYLEMLERDYGPSVGLTALSDVELVILRDLAQLAPPHTRLAYGGQAQSVGQLLDEIARQWLIRQRYCWLRVYNGH